MTSCIIVFRRNSSIIPNGFCLQKNEFKILKEKPSCLILIKSVIDRREYIWFNQHLDCYFMFNICAYDCLLCFIFTFKFDKKAVNTLI